MRHSYNPSSGGGTTLAAEGFSNNTVHTNDTVAPVSALSGTTGVLPAGTYEVDVSYSWNHGGNPSTDMVAELAVDGTSVVGAWAGAMHRGQPVDAAGGDISGTLTDQAYGFHRRFVMTFGVAATHTFDLTFASSQAGDRTALWDPSVVFRQIA